MSEIFKKVSNQFKNKLPFVVYCKPNSSKKIAFFQKNDTLFELNDTNGCGFAFVSFDNLQRFILPENECDFYFEKNNSTDFYVPSKTTLINKNSEKKQLQFEKLVAGGIDFIIKHNFEKIVLSRKVDIILDQFDFETIFNKLIIKYEAAFKYIFYHPKIGLWIGATPEQLLKTEGLLVKTVSLAGTQLFSKSKNAEWQQKELKEQQIVTNYILQIFKKISDNIVISKPYSVQAGNLIHLKTDFQATVANDFKIEQLVNLLHPTPAVCGLPSNETKQYIIENERYNRSFYTGYVGEWKKNFETFSKNDTDLYVNLRCMKIENNSAQLYVGCGITSESKPEKEFLESENKLQTMLAVL